MPYFIILAFNELLFQLQDLKQVSSWSSKERLTTQVVYDEITKSYVAIFNTKTIRIWEEKETNLDMAKKFKSSMLIYTILKLKGVPPVLVTSKGATVSLESALVMKKDWKDDGILSSNETIEQCQLICVNNVIYFCALINSGNFYSYIFVPLRNDTFALDVDKLTKIDLKRLSEKLVGHVIIHDKNNVHLLTLCKSVARNQCTILCMFLPFKLKMYFTGSHGRLYSYPLTFCTREPVPGTLVGVITTINTKHPVAIIALDENTIAAYGADAHEEGAILFIYNVHFNLVQAVQKLKLYTTDARLWKIEDKILLAANRHLAVAPFCLAPQRIEAIIGSTTNLKNDSCSKDSDIMVIQESKKADWGINSSSEYSLPLTSLNDNIANQISTLLNEGMSDAAICHSLIPSLIESRDASSILWCLSHLRDLPAELLIQIFKFCLNCDGSISTQEISFSSSQKELLDKISTISFTDISLVYYLRAGLNFSEILKLLNYFLEKFNDSHPASSIVTNSPAESNDQLCEWIAMLLDSHYTHCLLSQDHQVLIIFKKLMEILETKASIFF